MSQAELIKRAFAGDDVQADFEASKAAEVEEELPKQARRFPRLFQYQWPVLLLATSGASPVKSSRLT